MEDLLEAAFPEAHGFVDGHDFGAGQMNIFVHTARPLEAFRDAMTSLSPDPRWAGALAAYRPVEGDHYVPVWPTTLEGFSVSRRRMMRSHGGEGSWSPAFFMFRLVALRASIF